MPRLYYAVSFTCVFCVLFLLGTDLVWASAKILLGAMTVHARTRHHARLAVGPDLDNIFRWFANAGMAAIAIAFAYGYTVGQLRLRVRQFALTLRNWPSSLDRLRIVQISDIHIGQNIERAQLERFVARVNQLAPDILCITMAAMRFPIVEFPSAIGIGNSGKPKASRLPSAAGPAAGKAGRGPRPGV